MAPQLDLMHPLQFVSIGALEHTALFGDTQLGRIVRKVEDQRVTRLYGAGRRDSFIAVEKRSFDIMSAAGEFHREFDCQVVVFDLSVPQSGQRTALCEGYQRHRSHHGRADPSEYQTGLHRNFLQPRSCYELELSPIPTLRSERQKKSYVTVLSPRTWIGQPGPKSCAYKACTYSESEYGLRLT